MAAMNRPGQTYEGQGNVPANWRKNNSDVQRQGNLWHYSAEDPRLTGEQRIDQRYGNYTYGSDPQYAQGRATEMQGRGTGAQQTLGTYGDQAAERGGQIYGRNTPETDYARANQSLGQQQGAANRLMDFAESGPGPSQAEAQLAASTARNQRAQTSLAMSGRGPGGNAAAMRDAMQNSAVAQGAANADAAGIRAQETDAFNQRKLQALGMAGDTYGSMAGQESQNAQFDVSSELEGQAQRDNASLGYSQLGLDSMNAGYNADLAYEQEGRTNLENELDANMGYEENLTNIALGGQQLTNSREQRSHDRDSQLIDAGTGAIAAVGGLISDEHQKKGIRDTDLNSRYEALNDSPGTGRRPRENETLDKLKRDREMREIAAQSEAGKEEGGGLGGMLGGMMSSDEHSKERIRELEQLNDRYAALVDDAQGDGGSERTSLSGEEERKFQAWAKANNVTDVDHPESFYDYRGFWKDNGGPRIRGGVDHFPDTYKQHGHPTFSVESRYSRGPSDGGRWEGEDFVAGAHAPARSTTYEYKDPNAPGAGKGRYSGPMAQDLEGIPGVVKETPRGKMVDPGRLTLANTSAIGSQERRLRAIEGARSSGALTDDEMSRYEALVDEPPAQPRAVNTSAAPSAPVQKALRAYGGTAPNDEEIALAREDLRAQHGSAAADEFERYATALRRERQKVPAR